MNLAMNLIYTTIAQKQYNGPEELRIFADFLPYIGEAAVSFSRLEKRITWAIESILSLSVDEAYEIEEIAKSFTSRLLFLKFVGAPVARETGTEEGFRNICALLSASNKFRNDLLHNSFAGIQIAETMFLNKERFHEKPEKRPYKISLEDLRKNTAKNLEICVLIQTWVLAVRPEAENRVP
jgi:hypothetical protein